MRRRVGVAAADPMRRRVCLAAAAACAAPLGFSVAPPVRAVVVASDHGRVDPPVAIPNVPVRCAGDGASAGLAGMLRGRATALHLMFTGCSSVCPMQGAIFERVQELLPDQQTHGIQLMSFSIDPLADTPRAMRAWLERFDAREGWIAVAPMLEDLSRMLDLFGQGQNALETHATQVSIIDRRADLVFRTPELPSADAIANMLRRV
jgi:protein SCO1/2